MVKANMVVSDNDTTIFTRQHKANFTNREGSMIIHCRPDGRIPEFYVHLPAQHFDWSFV